MSETADQCDDCKTNLVIYHPNGSLLCVECSIGRGFTLPTFTCPDCKQTVSAEDAVSHRDKTDPMKHICATCAYGIECKEKNETCNQCKSACSELFRHGKKLICEECCIELEEEKRQRNRDRARDADR